MAGGALARGVGDDLSQQLVHKVIAAGSRFAGGPFSLAHRCAASARAHRPGLDWRGVGGTLIPARTFDALFRHLRPEGSFLHDLLEAGFDPRSLQKAYPAETWRAALEIARRHRFAQLPPAAGFHALGHAAVDGFVETLVGRVYGLMLPAFGPERVMIHFPSYVSLVRPDATTTLQSEGVRCWRATMHVPLTFPSFTGGVLERALHRAGGVNAVVEVQNVDQDRFDLLARW